MLFGYWKKVYDWETGTGTGQGMRMLEDCAEEDRAELQNDISREH